MKFSEIRHRLTGISCPVFGVSWSPSEPDRAIARRLIAFLEDRRVLYVDSELEVPSHCVESVLQIRAFCTAELQHLDPGHPIAQRLAAMRAACRRFVERLGPQAPTIIRHGGSWGHWASWTFASALGELRGQFGVQIAQLATQYGLDIEDQLASTLPGMPDSSPQ